ncbi:MAG: signal peptidase I [Alphaproteobacteria bacterium]|nr:signal peptidase I [Alphaproteobacteria bacterium]
MSANTNEAPAPRKPPLTAKEELGDFFRTALLAILLAVFIRSFFYEPFNIPSGSMRPTLEVGDYLFVQKPAYGYSRYSFPFGFAPIRGRIWAAEPARGDVIVFKLPSNPYVDYIKRVVALPGETVQVRNGRLYLSGKMVPRESTGLEKDIGADGTQELLSRYTETLPGGVVHSIYETSDTGMLDNTPEYTVPEGHYFVMGDNRDNSQDSRVSEVVGFVPFENIVGRADFIFYSTNGSAGLFEFWKWPWTIRYERLFNSIRPHRTASDLKE